MAEKLLLILSVLFNSDSVLCVLQLYFIFVQKKPAIHASVEKLANKIFFLFRSSRTLSGTPCGIFIDFYRFLSHTSTLPIP